MTVRLKIIITEEEYAALMKLAIEQLREPEDQMRFLLREELRKKGLLSSDQQRISGPSNDIENLGGDNGLQT